MNTPAIRPVRQLPHNINRILLISTRQIGDVLLTTPLLRSLKKAFPDADIDVLVFQGKGGILEGNPDVHQLLNIAERPSRAAHWQLLKTLWRQYDLAVSTLAGDKPSLYAICAARFRVGLVPQDFAKAWWKRALFQGWSYLDDWHTHTVSQNLCLADVLGIPRQHDLVLPRLDNSATRLRQYLPFDYAQTAYAVLHLSPMWQYKRWTDQGWIALSAYLSQQSLQLVFTGGMDDQEQVYIQNILQQIPTNTHNLAGKLRFADLSLLLENAHLYVGPDTAITHLAAAAGIPCCALFGPTNPLKWAPWPKGYQQANNPFKQYAAYQQQHNIHLIQGAGDCVPCHQEGCERHRQSHSRCLDELSAEQVIQVCQTILNQ